MAKEIRDVAKTDVNFFFGDGEHRFALPLAQIRELQEKTGAGPLKILARLRAGDWTLDDVRETIRLGLIGGGAAPSEAYRLMVAYVDGRPWAENVMPAQLILSAALFGMTEPTPIADLVT